MEISHLPDDNAAGGAGSGPGKGRRPDWRRQRRATAVAGSEVNVDHFSRLSARSTENLPPPFISRAMAMPMTSR
jgi:hypothetical protein